MFCSHFLDDVSFGHNQSAWEDDSDIGFDRLLSISNVTVHCCVSWHSQCLNVLLSLSLCGCTLLVFSFVNNCKSRSYVWYVLIPAVMLLINWILLYVLRAASFPGLDDRDSKNAAEEKKRAYQFELQRQVTLFHLQEYSTFITYLQFFVVIIVKNCICYIAVLECMILVCDRWQKINSRNKEKRRKKKRKLQHCTVRCRVDGTAFWIRWCVKYNGFDFSLEHLVDVTLNAWKELVTSE